MPDVPQSELRRTNFHDSGGSLGQELGEELDEEWAKFWANISLVYGNGVDSDCSEGSDCSKWGFDLGAARLEVVFLKD